MILKTVGAFLIIGSCGYWGIKISQTYQKRSNLLQTLQNGLNLLETEINYSLTPLPYALTKVGKMLSVEGRIIFAEAGEYLSKNKGVTAFEAWNEGLNKLGEKIPLTAQEKTILSLFGRSLGSSAKDEQLKNIALVKEQLKMLERIAEVEREKNQRIWKYMGVCLGAVIVLILI